METEPPKPTNLEEHVSLFALDMLQELRANEPRKGDFLNWRPTHPEWRSEVQHHLDKLDKAIEEGNESLIREYTADTANYMIAARINFISSYAGQKP